MKIIPLQVKVVKSVDIIPQGITLNKYLKINGINWKKYTNKIL